ncbi:TauD/TfdA family dioxygenase [Francisella sp. 19X1-34]|uniref:TauD/TfdA family dioxygenase n=1 Tax=Francisella sp. 19X1-34 TaxID=3087177 RepID=UPI002E35792F|nr:TauD/TfdA family dioxygenase [Francisella sp. 19X1-34]MED7788718.1 TauD/TfdA family dioxygenase [Francisella sp. 19X1-34]
MLNNQRRWKNNDIFEKNPESFYELNSFDICDINNALNQAMELNLPYFVLRKGDVSLGEFKDKLVGFREIIENGSGIMRLRGLPIDKYSIGELKLIFYIICLELGCPVPSTPFGEMLSVIETLDDSKNTKDGKTISHPRSPKSLSFHTDIICDINSLFYLQKAKQGGELFVANSLALYDYFLENEPDVLNELCKPYYYNHHPLNIGKKENFFTLPIFSINEEKVISHCVPRAIKDSIEDKDASPIYNSQIEALDRLVELVNSNEYSVNLNQEDGDMVFLNSFTTMHARTEYKDSDKTDKKRKIFRVLLYAFKYYELTKPAGVRKNGYIKVVPDMVC